MNAACVPPMVHVPHMHVLLQGLGLDGFEPDDDLAWVDTAFLDFLLTEFSRLIEFDAAFYTAANPDVAAALQRGELADAHDHFVRFGYREGRLPHAMPFDPDVYLARNPDLQAVLADMGRGGLRAHYDANGRHEGRAAHSSALTDAERWLQAIHRTPYRLAQRSIDGALVQPFAHPLVAPTPLGFRGGPVLGEAALDRRLRHRRAGLPVDSFPPSGGAVGALHGEYVYAGPAIDHFGHAMAEPIHRVLPARAVFACRRLLFVGTGSINGKAAPDPAGFDALPAVLQAPLLFLDVAPAEVTVIHDDRVVQTLHVVQQGAELTGSPTAPYLAMLAAFTPARLEALHDGSPAASRLYVSRSQAGQGGVLLGERYLEALLQADGWTVFHPQDHSLLAQMQAYHRAETIIFAEGSACHGTELFGTHGLGHLLLLPRRHDHRHVFETVLRSRARRFDTLPSATLLGSVLADPVTGALLTHLGVSALDLPAIARSLRALGLAVMPGLDPARYRAAARADLAAYLAHHRKPLAHHELGACLRDAAGRSAFAAECAQALRG